MAADHENRSGFTIVEVLAVVAIIAVLLAILVPVLARSRDSAQHTARLSWGRQLGQATAMYTSDFDGFYPYLGVPRSSDGPVSYEGVHLSQKPFYNRYFWINPIADGYLADASSPLPWTISGGPPRGIFSHVPEGVLISGWSLSATTCATVEFWRTETVPQEGMLRGMGVHQVVFPAQKVILMRGIDPIAESVCVLSREGRGVDQDAADELVLADGSARTYIERELTGSVAEGRPSQWGAIPMPMHATVDGVAGRDF